MGTNIRPELTKKNQYYIPKHRYYELRHYCLQYKEWKDIYRLLSSLEGPISIQMTDTKVSNSLFLDTYFVDSSIKKIDLLRNIELVETCAKEADENLCDYIMKAVTDNVSFVKLKTQYDMPCEKDMFYDRFRKFFWLIHQKKGI